MSAVVSRASRLLTGRGRAAEATAKLADSAAILGALPVPVILLDAENRFRHVNHAAEQFLGISAAWLAQHRLPDLLPADNPLFLSDRAGAPHRSHDLRPRPEPGKSAAAQARDYRAGFAAAGGAWSRCCW